MIKEIGYNKSIILNEKNVEMLLSNRPNERSATNRHVMALAKSIENIGWTGSVISVSESGELLDGQNRLLAIRHLGFPSVRATIRVFTDSEITPELRSSFNKSRPQSLRDTMKMCFGWGALSSRKVPVYSYLARICNGDKFPTDEYLMLLMDESFPSKLTPFISARNRNELSCDIKCAFLICGIADDENVMRLKNDVEQMIFTSQRCHARRIYDYLHSDITKSNDSKHEGHTRGHGTSFQYTKKVVFAIDKYLKGDNCPVLENVDQKKVDDAFLPYVEMIKQTVRFK